MKSFKLRVLTTCITLLLLGAGITVSADEQVLEINQGRDLEITSVIHQEMDCDLYMWVVTVTNVGSEKVYGYEFIVCINLSDASSGWNVTLQMPPVTLNPGENFKYFLIIDDIPDGIHDDIIIAIWKNADTPFTDDNMANNIKHYDETIVIECNPDDDFGDAPECKTAYPVIGGSDIIGSFPTCIECGNYGYISHTPNGVFFGPSVDSEIDGNAGKCMPPDCFPPYDNDEGYNDGDAGLLIPDVFTIDSSNTIVPINGGMTKPLGYIGQHVHWGIDIDIDVHTPDSIGAYVNVLIDWNQSGDWMNPDDHVLVNFWVPAGFSGKLSTLHPPSFDLGSKSGYFWARFTITNESVDMGWFGEGEFDHGETEDYLLKIIEEPEPVYKFYPNAKIPPYCTMNATDDVDSYFLINLTNVPDGYHLDDGYYPGWCFEKSVSMTREEEHPVNLSHSYDPNMPVQFKNTNWDLINYLINHKGSYSKEDIQEAIWGIMDAYTPFSIGAQQLIAEAETYGNNYCPSNGELLAVLISLNESHPTVVDHEYPPVQSTFIEVPLNYASCPPAFWNHTHNAWPAGFDPSENITEFFNVGSAYYCNLSEAVNFTPMIEPDKRPNYPIMWYPDKLLKNLLMNAVTALLNANHPCIHYPLTHHQILVLINDLLDNNNILDIFVVNLWISMYNQIDCEPGCCPCSEPLQQ